MRACLIFHFKGCSFLNQRNAFCKCSIFITAGWEFRRETLNPIFIFSDFLTIPRTPPPPPLLHKTATDQNAQETNMPPPFPPQCIFLILNINRNPPDIKAQYCSSNAVEQWPQHIFYQVSLHFKGRITERMTSLHVSQAAHAAQAHLGFLIMKLLGVLLLPSG